jgi:predicted ATPase with chaperone activity
MCNGHASVVVSGPPTSEKTSLAARHHEILPTGDAENLRKQILSDAPIVDRR